MYENNLINTNKLYNVYYIIKINVDNNIIINIIAKILIVINLRIKF